MAKLMQINFDNSKLKQSEKAYQLGSSSSTLQRYRNDKNVSPYRIQTNNTNKRSKRVSNTKINNNQHSEHDLKRPQRTSKDLKSFQMTAEFSHEVKAVKSKNKLKSAANVEFNDQYLYDILHSNNS